MLSNKAVWVVSGTLLEILYHYVLNTLPHLSKRVWRSNRQEVRIFHNILPLILTEFEHSSQQVDKLFFSPKLFLLNLAVHSLDLIIKVGQCFVQADFIFYNFAILLVASNSLVDQSLQVLHHTLEVLLFVEKKEICAHHCFEPLFLSQELFQWPFRFACRCQSRLVFSHSVLER